MPAALDDLVARVEAGVVVFVLLEQVFGAHLVAVHQKTLPAAVVRTFRLNTTSILC